MLRNRYEELNAQRIQLLAEIEAFNTLAQVYGIEPIRLSGHGSVDSKQKNLYFSSISEAKNYLGANGFKSLGTRSYSK